MRLDIAFVPSITFELDFFLELLLLIVVSFSTVESTFEVVPLEPARVMSTALNYMKA